jgi:hypothetical protein
MYHCRTYRLTETVKRSTRLVLVWASVRPTASREMLGLGRMLPSIKMPLVERKGKVDTSHSTASTLKSTIQH